MKQDISGIQKYLIKTISTHGAASESSYHGLIIGLCAALNNLFYVSSNRESGMGRYDVQLVPQNKKLSGILMELKVLREAVRPEAVRGKQNANLNKTAKRT